MNSIQKIGKPAGKSAETIPAIELGELFAVELLIVGMLVLTVVLVGMLSPEEIRGLLEHFLGNTESGGVFAELERLLAAVAGGA